MLNGSLVLTPQSKRGLMFFLPSKKSLTRLQSPISKGNLEFPVPYRAHSENRPQLFYLPPRSTNSPCNKFRVFYNTRNWTGVWFFSSLPNRMERRGKARASAEKRKSESPWKPWEVSKSTERILGERDISFKREAERDAVVVRDTYSKGYTERGYCRGQRCSF